MPVWRKITVDWPDATHTARSRTAFANNHIIKVKTDPVTCYYSNNLINRPTLLETRRHLKIADPFSADVHMRYFLTMSDTGLKPLTFQNVCLKIYRRRKLTTHWVLSSFLRPWYTSYFSEAQQYNASCVMALNISAKQRQSWQLFFTHARFILEKLEFTQIINGHLLDHRKTDVSSCSRVKKVKVIYFCTVCRLYAVSDQV
jgi:hypothetical protein